MGPIDRHRLPARCGAAHVLAVLVLGAIGARPAAADAPSILFYQNSQDQARSIDVDTLAAGPTVSGFLGAAAGNGRNIQADGDDGLLWYADTAGNIRSKEIATGNAGPTLTSTLFAGANSGAARHFSLDPFANRLYYSVTDGSVQVLDLDTLSAVDTIPATAFLGANPGGLRHTTIDPVNRRLYYASTDGAIYSFSLNDFQQAGPTVTTDLIAGGNSGEARHLIYDSSSGWLWYSVTDGRVASVDPLTGNAGPTLASNLFNEVVGAGRIITMTFQVAPEPGALHGSLVALAVLAARAAPKAVVRRAKRVSDARHSDVGRLGAERRVARSGPTAASSRLATLR